MVYTVVDEYADIAPGDLAAYERQDRKAPTWRVTWAEAKLLLIASTGFFIDAYDLFSINFVLPMLNYVYNKKASGTIANIALKGGVLKAAANLGCIPGQIFFGLMGDIFGRRAVYGKELMVLMFGVILTIACPNSLGVPGVFTWITCWRVVMGFGIGGDYPMSAAVVSDRSNINRRGVMLAFIFAMQGWGTFIAGIVCIIVLSAYRPSMEPSGPYGGFNGAWRIVVGLILFPCMGTLYQRLTLPESGRFKNVQALRDDPSLILGKNDKLEASAVVKEVAQGHDTAGTGSAKRTMSSKANAFGEFITYFSEWRHLRTLVGTAMTWFLLDIAFYGINLNQSIVISAIHYNTAKEPWHVLWQNTKANLIIVVAGYLPGYYFTMAFVEKIGRKNIQFFGFLFEALFLGIVAGDWDNLQVHHGGFIACFVFLQFFFNFGANATTFIVPAEVFPTRVRGFAHGFSAACGKAGSVLASLGFANWAAELGHDGTAKVLWIFFGICVLGAFFTLLIPETTGRDADVIDLKERQLAMGTATGAPVAAGSASHEESVGNGTEKEAL